MGKGDKRSRRGKISAGTFGKARPKARKKKVAKAATTRTPVKKKAPAKK